MINTWLVSGDTHGSTSRFNALDAYEPGTAAIIILGDVAFNYHGNEQDYYIKRKVNAHQNYIYCVRGNHEMRPTDIPTMEKFWDENVANMVYYEPEHPYIRYFIDGYCYDIGGHHALVIGGAFSVDKDYRLAMNRKWFPNEQLTTEEMNNISKIYANDEFDIILSHTCPLSWQPTDLFLNFIDQSKVDNSMEIWMDNFKDNIKYNIWLFGHYHHDRLVRPHVEMLSTDIQKLDDIYNHWNDGTWSIPLYWELDPKFSSPDHQWWEKEKDRWIQN